MGHSGRTAFGVYARHKLKIVIDTNVVSPHVAPVALALDRLDAGSVRYVYYSTPSDVFRSKEMYKKIEKISINLNGDRGKACEIASVADFVLENVRDFELISRRIGAGRPTAYCSERWFKPIRVDAFRNSERATGSGFFIGGFLKVLLPFAFRRALRMVRLLRARNKFIYLANGVFAARDMARMCGLFNGDLRCLFRAPALEFERFPGGRVWAKDGNDKKYCLEKIRMWGYFVEPSAHPYSNNRTGGRSNTLRVLWVGRMFGWKRLDTLIKAAGGVSGVELDIYGNGPDELEVREMASRYSNVHVYDSVLLSRVRELMREHDVYVLPSNSFEGWGAVINEALEEGMNVLGTYEAGACATILSETNLFHCGDWRSLRMKLLEPIPSVSIGPWTANNAAQELLRIARELNGESA